MHLPGRNYSILPTQVTNKKILVIWKPEKKLKGAFEFNKTLRALWLSLLNLTPETNYIANINAQKENHIP